MKKLNKDNLLTYIETVILETIDKEDLLFVVSFLSIIDKKIKESNDVIESMGNNRQMFTMYLRSIFNSIPELKETMDVDLLVYDIYKRISEGR